MRMPPPAMIRTAATAQGVPGIWPWRSDAPDWPARDPHISLATRTRIWMSPCHPPLCRHPLTWPQGAQRVTNQSENQPIPSCIYFIWCALSVVYIYRITIAYVYRISSEVVSVSLPVFLGAFIVRVCCPAPSCPAHQSVFYLYMKNNSIFDFCNFFLWVSFSFFFMSFHCVLRPTFFTFRSRLCCTLHTLIQVIWLYKFWFRFEFLIHYYFNLEFIFVSR